MKPTIHVADAVHVALDRTTACALLIYLPQLSEFNRECAPAIAAGFDRLGQHIFFDLLKQEDEGAIRLYRETIESITKKLNSK